MRVGIDGRVLLGRKTGDRTYARGLVRGLLRLPTPPEVVVMLDRDPGEALQGELAGAECAIRERPGGYLWTLMALPRLAAETRVDLLHVQYMTPFAAPCPLITTIHDISFRLHPEWFPPRHRLVMNTFIPGSVRRAHAVLTPSAATAADIRRAYGCPPSKLHVTPYAAPSEFSRPPHDDAVRDCLRRLAITLPYMLYVGNLQPRKNVARLLRAFARARTETGFAHRLVVVGQAGWRCEDEMRELRSAEAAGHALRVGYVDDSDLPALYAAADAFLFPTLMEGFGLPVLEAMAMGTPVLASNTSSLPEVAGDAALLVDPTDEGAIATGIAALAADGGLRARLRDAGLARAAQFSWRRTAELTRAVYQSVLART
ncbi:MAG TPA: glycosyltransferase family 1 protein [Armatimonadetes bacterium]|nr:glycosyltransferase family 1 protein [Armatimonadota bacterium]